MEIAQIVLQVLEDLTRLVKVCASLEPQRSWTAFLPTERANAADS